MKDVSRKLTQNLLYGGNILLLRKELFNFLKNPRTLSSDKKLYFKFYELGKLFAFNIAIVGLLSICLSLIFKEKTNINSSIFSYPFWPVIWGPILEELMFRFQLRISKFNLSLGFGILSALPLGLLKYGVWNQLYSFTITFLIITILLNIKPILRKVTLMLNKNYLIYFYALSFLFGILHMTNPYNHELFNKFGYIAFLSIIPQLFTGLIMGFIRLKYGIVFSIIYHMFFNFYAIITMTTLISSFFVVCLFPLNYYFLTEEHSIK